MSLVAEAWLAGALAGVIVGITVAIAVCNWISLRIRDTLK